MWHVSAPLTGRNRSATAFVTVAKAARLQPKPQDAAHFLKGSGRQPIRRCLAVWWWLLSIALATRGRAGAADLFKNPSGCWGFRVFRGSGWEKEGKIRRCVLEVLVGRFSSIFGQVFIIFWYYDFC